MIRLPSSFFGHRASSNNNSCTRRAFKTGFRRARFGFLGGGARGFTLCSGAQVQLNLIVLPHGAREITALLATSTVRAFGGALPPTMPSADFCAAVRSPCGSLSLVAETQRRSPEVRPTAFAARPSDLPPRPLMAVDFAIRCSLVRPGRPRYPLLVHRAATLLHAVFRPHLAMTPLRFANPSPPSGWIEDFHLQAVVHTRHTTQSPARRPGSSPRARATRWGVLSTGLVRNSWWLKQHNHSARPAARAHEPAIQARQREIRTLRPHQRLKIEFARVLALAQGLHALALAPRAAR